MGILELQVKRTNVGKALDILYFILFGNLQKGCITPILAEETEPHGDQVTFRGHTAAK